MERGGEEGVTAGVLSLKKVKWGGSKALVQALTLNGRTPFLCAGVEKKMFAGTENFVS